MFTRWPNLEVQQMAQAKAQESSDLQSEWITFSQANIVFHKESDEDLN